MPLILPGNVASATASTTYSVTNSCRFDGSSAYLSRTNGTATNTKICTFSAWLKKCNIDNYQRIFTAQSDVSGRDSLYILSGELGFYFRNGTSGSIGINGDRKFRDPSAWYHLVVACDSTQATASNRIKIYINGTQQTLDGTQVTQDQTLSWNEDNLIAIGSDSDGSPSEYFDGYMAEVVMIDGLQLAPTSFGEFDSDSPTIWKPIDVSGLTFGTNGFYLSYSDSADLGADSSGNSNDFTATNLDATDQATDTPTNNFCTMNPLDNYFFGATFSEGNLKVATTDSIETFGTGTMGVASGKWYWEVKLTSESAYSNIGIASEVSDSASNYLGEKASTPNYMYDSYAGDSYTSGSGTSYGNSYTTGDIIGVALNLDDNEIKYYKNGTVQNSGTAISITAAASTPIGFYFPAAGERHDDDATFEFNFGNPSFSISSGNADGNGYGDFEYAVPSGYYALCTKNLAEYG